MFLSLQFHFILVPSIKREMRAVEMKREDSMFTADWKKY